ncbi:sterol desaturase family protein [Conexibacter sp. DBS9H8]|uniref:sterol desaturase family protein n=1 Tax=Conexibacter sp. DBS9H8 TaxID=2937801 RepID=UPI00200D1907|nr:sterol desaturase family protein [Conexibacter sp. DBS9H8]
MFNLILYAIPFFLATLAVEWLQFRHDRAEERESGLVGYARADTLTSLAMGIGNVITNTAWKVVVVAVYAALYELTPLRISPAAWWAWPALFVADDVAYYAYHRASHRVRVFWASHVVHHSSQHYNLSTALRQPWTPMTYFLFWIPLALIGFPPWMILLEQSVSLTYQFFIHTERVRQLWRPLELVLNTPSHHRGHHGANAIYLDKNYGGILIVWDRLLGTFESESERVRYGLTRNLDTFNPLRVATHEWLAIAEDLRLARTWGDRIGFLLRTPGWAYARRAALTSEGAVAAVEPLAGALT